MLVVGSPMYAQVCMHLNIIFIVKSIREILEESKCGSLKNSQKSNKISI